jgi:O-acetylhomoserine (thiol)-lyase
MEEKNKYEAAALHIPFEKEDAYHSIAMPVYNTAAFEFETAEEMEKAFCGQTAEHTYSRLTNPTVQYLETRVRITAGALGVTALNSGMAAVSNALMSIAYAGSNIVTSPHLFGNTYSFLASTLKDFGVEVRFCDLTDPEKVEAMMDENTCALFLEIITNPQMEVADLKKLSAVARKKGVPLLADTTIIPFTAFRAKEFGVDIEIVSSTKYISGGATSLGGLILDYGTFDWRQSKRLKELAKGFGNAAFTVKLRKEIHRNLGAYMTPQVAYMQTLGLETLQLRYERQAGTCLELAKRLAATPQIESANYNGLPDNPFYEVSLRQFGALVGAMLTFDLSSREACFLFLNRLKLIRRATNLFDNRTLAIHPASTIFGTFSEAIRQEMNISPKAIRLSIGLEDIDSLYDDILQALG